MRKVTVIEDDADLYGLVKYNLEKEGYSVSGQQTGKGAVELCRRVQPDVVLLDVMLPDADGIYICKTLKDDPQMSATPIILVTARASEADRVVGLEMGANDYVVKPFFIRELISRVKVQLRGATRSRNVRRVGDLELDSDRLQVSVRGRPVSLTATEFRLLEHMVGHAGLVFGREQLLSAVWQNENIFSRAVDVYILRLRQKIEVDPANPRMIFSVRGFGYTFDPDRQVV